MILVYLFASVNFQQCFIVENVHVSTKLIHAHVHNARQKYCSCFEVQKVYIIATLLRFSPFYLFSQKDQIMTTLAKQNCVLTNFATKSTQRKCLK